MAIQIAAKALIKLRIIVITTRHQHFSVGIEWTTLSLATIYVLQLLQLAYQPTARSTLNSITVHGAALRGRILKGLVGEDRLELLTLLLCWHCRTTTVAAGYTGVLLIHRVLVVDLSICIHLASEFLSDGVVLLAPLVVFRLCARIVEG